MAKLDRDAIDGLAERVLESGMAPAVALAVTDRDRTLLARTYGAASPGALWPVGSIGKSFTAAVALQLVEEGLLDLHAPVTKYVPWLSVRTPGGPIALHHLLTHTAGLVESSDVAPASNYDVVALAGTETGYAPGAHRHYSNLGYRAVGVILEAVTGRPYPELLQRRVLDRLGLDASSPVMAGDIRRRLPGGHVPLYDDRPWRPEHGVAPGPWVESAEADGCVCCSVQDLAAWLRALWAGGDLLSGESLAAMKTRRRTKATATATGSTTTTTASATTATCSATSRTCGPTRQAASAWWRSRTGSAAPGGWARRSEPWRPGGSRRSST